MSWDRWFRWDAIGEASRELAESLAVHVLSLDGALCHCLQWYMGCCGSSPAPWWWLALHPPGKVPIVGWQVVIQRTLLYECRDLIGDAQPHVFKKCTGPALTPSFLLIWSVISVEQWFLTGPPQDRCSHPRGGSLWSHSCHFQRFCLLEQLAVVFICSESNLELRNPIPL